MWISIFQFGEGSFVFQSFPDIRVCHLLLFVRRADKEPGPHSRVCLCHLECRKKENGPTMFERNKDKLFDFPDQEPLPKSRYQ